eukprot:2984472-Amphidinium_carterae.1
MGSRQNVTQKNTKPQELTDEYNHDNRLTISRNTAKKRRRDRGKEVSHDEELPPAPELPDV